MARGITVETVRVRYPYVYNVIAAGAGYDNPNPGYAFPAAAASVLAAGNEFYKRASTLVLGLVAPANVIADALTSPSENLAGYLVTGEVGLVDYLLTLLPATAPYDALNALLNGYFDGEPSPVNGLRPYADNVSAPRAKTLAYGYVDYSGTL